MRRCVNCEVQRGSTAGNSPEATNAGDENRDTNCNESQSWETIRLYTSGPSQTEKSSIAGTSKEDLAQFLSGLASKEWKPQVFFYDPFTSAGLSRRTPEQEGKGNIQDSRRAHRRGRGSKARADAVANVIRDLELMAAEAAAQGTASTQEQECSPAAPTTPSAAGGEDGYTLTPDLATPNED